MLLTAHGSGMLGFGLSREKDAHLSYYLKGTLKKPFKIHVLKNAAVISKHTGWGEHTHVPGALSSSQFGTQAVKTLAEVGLSTGGHFAPLLHQSLGRLLPSQRTFDCIWTHICCKSRRGMVGIQWVETRGAA